MAVKTSSIALVFLFFSFFVYLCSSAPISQAQGEAAQQGKAGGQQQAPTEKTGTEGSAAKTPEGAAKTPEGAAKAPEKGGAPANAPGGAPSNATGGAPGKAPAGAPSQSGDAKAPSGSQSQSGDAKSPSGSSEAPSKSKAKSPSDSSHSDAASSSPPQPDGHAATAPVADAVAPAPSSAPAILRIDLAVLMMISASTWFLYLMV